MVALSFQEMPIVKDQYIKNGKYYVDVKNPKTGNVRSIRWLSQTEYAKRYGEKLAAVPRSGDPRDEAWEFYQTKEGSPGVKTAMGFKDGPILVIRGDKSSDVEYLRRSVARYALGIGWYIASTDELPNDAPPHFKYLLLSWNECRVDDTHRKRPSEIAEILSKKATNHEWFHIVP